jgi:hypothetical protein
LSLLVPEEEAVKVEYETQTISSRVTFHRKLTHGDGLIAHGARFLTDQPAPDPGETIHRQTVLAEFATDKRAERVNVVGQDGNLSVRAMR